MKKNTLIIFLVFMPGFCFAQVKKDSCRCTAEFSINTAILPAAGDPDERQGTVIAEYEIDSACFAYNPKIIQGIGELYDKEALRIANLMVAYYNNCKSRCKFHNCEKRKEKLPLTFASAD